MARTIWVPVLLLASCSTDSEDGGAEFSPEPEARDPTLEGGFGGEQGTPDPTAPGQAGPTGPDLAPPEEVEVESSFRAPVVTGRQIWTTNPVSGRVALVDALTHEVQTLPAGLEPTYLTAVGGDSPNLALVINRGSASATLFRRLGEEGIDLVDIPLHQGATAWTVSAAGRWAVAWSNERDYPELDVTEGLQDVTLIELRNEPRAQRFSVGYRPVQVTIDESESRLYAVTRDGISVIELGEEPRLLSDITLSDPFVDGPEAGEPVLGDVPISADGRYAVVRHRGSPRVEIVSLAENERQTIELPAEASDVDLVIGGTQAVAVSRETSQVALFDIEQAFADPSQVTLRSFETASLGSVALSEAGSHALLFTNAVDSDQLTMLNLSEDEEARTVSLKAPISAVFPSPEGSHAIALLETDSDSDHAGAFSVVPIASSLPAKIQGTEAPPFRVSIAETDSGLRGLLATRDDAAGVHAVYLVRMPSLQVDRLPLPSPVLAVGLLPEHGLGYVAQEHPEGRITFVDLETGRPQTLTGFELASRVVTGDTQ